jgi:hypothetical protein
MQPVLDALGEAWRANPDQRLMQLLDNVIGLRFPGADTMALFYVEEDQLLDALVSFNQGAKQDPPP